MNHCKKPSKRTSTLPSIPPIGGNDEVLAAIKRMHEAIDVRLSEIESKLDKVTATCERQYEAVKQFLVEYIILPDERSKTKS